MIRQYVDKDLEGMLEVWDAASAIAHPFLPADFMAAERENIPNLYLPISETWVYEGDAQVQGFIALIGNEVGGLFVHPKHQRKGIGGALMDQARKRCETLEVEVFTANAIGRSFYAKYGFVLIEQKIHEQTGFGLLRLRLPEAA